MGTQSHNREKILKTACNFVDIHEVLKASINGLMNGNNTDVNTDRFTKEISLSALVVQALNIMRFLPPRQLPSLARATECSDEFPGSVLQLTNSTKYERVFPQITQCLS